MFGKPGKGGMIPKPQTVPIPLIGMKLSESLPLVGVTVQVAILDIDTLQLLSKKRVQKASEEEGLCG